MSIPRACILTIVLGLAAGASFAGDEIFRIWSAPDVPVRERATAVNQSFTNGTPIALVIAVLGTNFTTFQKAYSAVWLGPGNGPEPGQNLGMIYNFRDGQVLIWTRNPRNPDPLSGNFGSAIGIPQDWLKPKVETGQPDRATNQSPPVPSATNQPSAAAGSGR